MLCTASLVHGDYVQAWDADAWWPLFAVIGVVCGLLGVRSLALRVRERQAAADTGGKA